MEVNKTSLTSFWDIFNDPTLLEAFRKFVVKRHCEENLLYWMDVQGFKVVTDDANLQAHANKILEKYFETNSPYELNVDAGDVKKLKTQAQNATRTMFNETQKFCFFLMINDSVPKFLQSQEYKVISLDLQDIKLEKKHKAIEKKTEKKLKQVISKNENIVKYKTNIEKDLAENKTIISYQNSDTTKLKEISNNLKKSCEDWEILSRVQVSLASNSISNLIQSTNETVKKQINSQAIFQKQVECITKILSSTHHRTIIGFLALIGEKWLNWNSESISKLSQKDETHFNKRERTVGITQDTFLTTNLNIQGQSSLMQFFDATQVLIDRYPNAFEFSQNYIILFAKLCCSKLPGVSNIPIYQPSESEDMVSIAVPEIISTSQLTAFVEVNAQVFRNSKYEDKKNSEFEELILLPSYIPDDQYHLNSLFDCWRLSSSKFLLEESIKLYNDNLDLSSILVKASELITSMKDDFFMIESFLKSIIIVESSNEISPRLRTGTAPSLSRGESTPSIKDKKKKLKEGSKLARSLGTSVDEKSKKKIVKSSLS